jgi:hypothetical protein
MTDHDEVWLIGCYMTKLSTFFASGVMLDELNESMAHGAERNKFDPRNQHLPPAIHI